MHKDKIGFPISLLDGHSENGNEDDDTSSEEINSCDRCDFVGETPADLNAHKTTKHLFGRFKEISKWTA